jgi:ubiquitin C-terminal hydrolase
MIHSVKKPKKAGYQPRMECRANNFCGLKNLGCTCYMNSMLQQFFCIPTLRYSLLSVKDKIGPNFKPFESDQVDDNLLH